MATNDLLFQRRNSGGGFSEQVVTPVNGKVLGFDDTGALTLLDAGGFSGDAADLTGTLDAARLPAVVPLLDGYDLDIAGTITTGQFTVAGTIYDGLQGTTVYDAGNGGNLFAQGYITWDGGQSGSDGAGNVYIGNSIYLGDSISGAGINGPSGAYFRDNGEQGWITGGGVSVGGTLSVGTQIYDSQNGINVYDANYQQFGPVDASNLTNVPPPAGINLGDSGGTLSLDVNSTGDFYVGDTQLLSGPNTLGPLDGSALTFGGAHLYDVLNNFSPNYAISSNYAYNAANDFDSFFHEGGYNTDTSLPGDGTFSFGNGSLGGDGTDVTATGNITASTFSGVIVGTTGTSAPLFSIGGTLFYPHVNGGVLTFTSTP